MTYEPVIGVEVHAELATQSKMFCGCANQFGAPPNTRTCPVCLGMPGALPVANKRAFDLVLKTALALHCHVPDKVWYDRKNYYYPDQPKNYQISQDSMNLGQNGYLEIQADGATKKVSITNVHIEEDAGKLIHPEGSGIDYTQVDLNRSGVPLIEIVSGPDMRSVEEVDAYMETLRNTLLYLDVSDCKMQEGSLRFEASISLRPRGTDQLGARVEVKNLNSMRAVCKALAYEIKRQTRVLEEGGALHQETRLWNEASGQSAPMRRKESAHDYRYFPEPDLVPVHISGSWREAMRASIPELPHARFLRLVRVLGISEYDAGVITSDRDLADYFEECARCCKQPKAAANLVTNEILKAMKERKRKAADFPIRPEAAAALLQMVSRGAINKHTYKEVFEEMLDSGRSAQEVVEARGLTQMSDADELEAIVRRVMDNHPGPVNDLRAGKQKAQGAIVGQVMRETKGKANPQLVNRLIRKILAVQPPSA